MQAFSRLGKSASDCNIIRFYSGFHVLGGSHNTLLQYADGGTLEEYFGVTPSPSRLDDKIEIWSALCRLLKAVADKHEAQHLSLGSAENFARCLLPGSKLCTRADKLEIVPAVTFGPTTFSSSRSAVVRCTMLILCWPIRVEVTTE